MTNDPPLGDFGPFVFIWDAGDSECIFGWICIGRIFALCFGTFDVSDAAFVFNGNAVLAPVAEFVLVDLDSNTSFVFVDDTVFATATAGVLVGLDLDGLGAVTNNGFCFCKLVLAVAVVILFTTEGSLVKEVLFVVVANGGGVFDFGTADDDFDANIARLALLLVMNSKSLPFPIPEDDIDFFRSCGCFSATFVTFLFVSIDVVLLLTFTFGFIVDPATVPFNVFVLFIFAVAAFLPLSRAVTGVEDLIATA